MSMAEAFDDKRLQRKLGEISEMTTVLKLKDVFQDCGKVRRFSVTAVDVRKACRKAVIGLVDRGLLPVPALYAIDRLIAFYEGSGLEFTDTDKSQMLNPVIKKVLSSENEFLLKQYNGVSNYQEAYSSIEEQLFKTASIIVKKASESDQGKMTKNALKFVCFMEFHRNEDRMAVNIHQILREVVSWSGAKGGLRCLFSALSCLCDSDLGKQRLIRFSTTDYRNTVKDTDSTAKVTDVLKEGVKLDRTPVLDFDFQELLALYGKEYKGLDEDNRIGFIAYVTVFREDAETRKNSLENCLKTLFERKSFTDLVTVVENLMKRVEVLLEEKLHNFENKRDLKEAIGNAVRLTLKTVKVKELTETLEKGSLDGKFVCLATFKAVLATDCRTSLEFTSEGGFVSWLAAHWKGFKDFVSWVARLTKIGGKQNDQVVLPALSFVVFSIWKIALKTELEQLTPKVLEWYQTTHQDMDLKTDFNTDMFSLILSTPLAGFEVTSFDKCSVKFKSVPPTDFASQVKTVFNAVKAVQPSLPSNTCSLLLFHIWKRYCKQAIDCIAGSEKLNRDAVCKIHDAVSVDQERPLLLFAMAATLIGQLFNNLLNEDKFYEVPGGAQLVSALSRSSRLMTEKDCSSAFEGYKKARVAVEEWIRKADDNEISMFDKSVYDTNESNFNSVVKVFRPNKAAKFKKDMDSVNFRGRLSELKANLELLGWIRLLSYYRHG